MLPTGQAAFVPARAVAHPSSIVGRLGLFGGECLALLLELLPGLLELPLLLSEGLLTGYDLTFATRQKRFPFLEFGNLGIETSTPLRELRGRLLMVGSLTSEGFLLLLPLSIQRRLAVGEFILGGFQLYPPATQFLLLPGRLAGKLVAIRFELLTLLCEQCFCLLEPVLLSRVFFLTVGLLLLDLATRMVQP